MRKKVDAAPAHLDAAARAEWDRIIGDLADATNSDVALIEAYCVSYARWRAAEVKLAETGPVVRSPQGGAMQSPWLSVSRAALRDLHKCLDALKPTPSRRTSRLAKDDDDRGLTLLDVG